MRSDALEVTNVVPRPVPRRAGSSQRDKMSKFLEPSFRLLTGTRKLQSGLSNKSLDELIDCGTPRVRFALSKNELIVVEILPGNKSELWWSSDELSASRSQGKLDASTDPEISEYLMSYDRAYKKVLTDKRITSDCLRDLVVGLNKGFRGLEDHAPGGNMTRKCSSIRSYVTLVVKHYHDCCRKELGDSKPCLARYDSARSICSLSRQASSLSLMSQGSSSGSGASPTSTHSAIDQSVRNYSKKLSAGSRNFAQAMGRAEHLAVGREKSECETPSTRTPVDHDADDDKNFAQERE